MTQASSSGNARSATNRPRPARKRGSSVRRTRAPIPSALTTRSLRLDPGKVERLVDRPVGDEEEIGRAAPRDVRGPRPVGNGENVVLGPFEDPLADGRAAFARDDERDRI